MHPLIGTRAFYQDLGDHVPYRDAKIIDVITNRDGETARLQFVEQPTLVWSVSLIELADRTRWILFRGTEAPRKPARKRPRVA